MSFRITKKFHCKDKIYGEKYIGIDDSFVLWDLLSKTCCIRIIKKAMNFSHSLFNYVNLIVLYFQCTD